MSSILSYYRSHRKLHSTSTPFVLATPPPPRKQTQKPILQQPLSEPSSSLDADDVLLQEDCQPSQKSSCCLKMSNGASLGIPSCQKASSSYVPQNNSHPPLMATSEEISHHPQVSSQLSETRALQHIEHPELHPTGQPSSSSVTSGLLKVPLLFSSGCTGAPPTTEGLHILTPKFKLIYICAATTSLNTYKKKRTPSE